MGRCPQTHTPMRHLTNRWIHIYRCPFDKFDTTLCQAKRKLRWRVRATAAIEPIRWSCRSHGRP